MNTARFLRLAAFVLVGAAMFCGKPAWAAIEDVRVLDVQPGADAAVTSYDNHFTLTLPSAALHGATRAEVTTWSADSLPIPAGATVLGGIYQFRVQDAGAVSAESYPVRISWQEDATTNTDLFYWDADAMRWRSLYGFGLLGSKTLSSLLPSGFSYVAVMAMPAIMVEGDASWYAYKKCDCAASPDYPKGTKLQVTRLDDPTRSVVVTINDFGPERDKFPERVIDLDVVAFKKIASKRAGVIRVRVDKI